MVAQVTAPAQQIHTPPSQKPTLIEEHDIKAILYVGLRGEIALPVENRKVDIFA